MHDAGSLVDLALFDLAGTLVRDDGVVLDAYRRVLDDANLLAPDEWLTAQMGRSKLQVFESLLERCERATSDAPALVRAFDNEMARRIRAGAMPALPGAREVIESCRASSVLVGYTTGFSRAIADLVVEHAHLVADVIVATDEVEHGRPAPDLIFEAMRRAGTSDPARVSTAGDTPSDLLAGDRAGCRFVIGLGCGTHALDDLRPYPHTHLLDDLATLPNILGLAPRA